MRTASGVLSRAFCVGGFGGTTAFGPASFSAVASGMIVGIGAVAWGILTPGAAVVGTCAPVTMLCRLIFFPTILLYWATASVAFTGSLNSAIELPLVSRIWKRSTGALIPLVGVGSMRILLSLSVPIAFCEDRLDTPALISANLRMSAPRCAAWV